jgi:uncharacterized protein (TIGR03000 family)
LAGISHYLGEADCAIVSHGLKHCQLFFVWKGSATMCKQRSISVRSLATLAVLAVLWTSGQAKAQYYQRFYRTNTGSMLPFMSSIDAPDTYGAYTEGPGFFYKAAVGPASAPEEQVAYVHIRVSPPHAEISIEGSKTAQIGSSRLYVSPPLMHGQNYTYDIRVSWKENGREVTQTRTVAVRAGDRLSVVFRAPADSGGSSTLQTRPATKPRRSAREGK